MTVSGQVKERPAARRGNLTVPGTTAIVLALHVLALAWLLHRPQVTLSATASARGGQSVAVQLVSRSSVAKPVETPAPKSLPAPPEQPKPKMPAPKPHPVLTTQAASTQQVQAADPTPAKATPPQAAAPSPPAAAMPPSTQASAAEPSAAPAAAPAATPGSSGPSLNIKSINASEMAQLNCHIPAPVYPAKAQRLGQKGTVTLRIVIGIDGRIGQVNVASSSGFAALDDAAVTALRGGVCNPYREAGIAMQVEASQRIAFAAD
ncbi:energy transducer TonB [Herbaspirillum rubrisubalbicans]|uniref:energy transducer TonB n=1 Tax=Herbaspirillum rubrisubalbicans TaxID=80842 RepID=UPI0020A6610A|nr:energy transducer TonB [Herbaspirillum rubrisubalbicans]